MQGTSRLPCTESQPSRTTSLKPARNPKDSSFISKVDRRDAAAVLEKFAIPNGLDVKCKDGKIFAMGNDKSWHVKTACLGDRIEVKEDQISDWFLSRAMARATEDTLADD